MGASSNVASSLLNLKAQVSPVSIQAALVQRELITNASYDCSAKDCSPVIGNSFLLVVKRRPR